MRLFIFGGFYLSFNAGFVNSIVIISSLHQAVSHVTGNIAKLGIAIEHIDIDEIILLAGLIFFFWFGAVITGLLVQYERFMADNRYGAVMFIEAALLLTATFLFQKHAVWAVNIIALACGMQNSMTTHYHGTIVRTTHMTGIVTDLGILFGHILRRQKIAHGKLAVQLALIGGFLLGGIGGAYSFARLNIQALLIPAGLIFLAAVGSYFLKQDYYEQ